VQADSTEISFLSLNGPIDFIFIDGGHESHIIRSDTENALNTMKSGLVIWHDYASGLHSDVADFLVELSQTRPIFHIVNSLVAFCIVGTGISQLLALAQHIGFAGFRDDGPLYYSRTVSLWPPLSFFYANMNFHGEHHLAPAVPYYNLPSFSRRLAQLSVDRKSIESGSFQWFGTLIKQLSSRQGLKETLTN